MIVKTKKYQLDTQTYIRLALANVLKEQWWVWFIPAAILLIPIVWSAALWWCVGIAATASILYLLFWSIQFAGAAQMEQSKILFEKLSYEIDSRQVLIKLNPREGMPLKWDQIQKVKREKDAFVLVVSRGHVMYWPFRIFKSDNDIRFVEAVLRRKGFLPEKAK
ncbi:YcxB family protein [Algivirga pacifica]|uniref:YcxB-like protein domain-containing protein n=1 Tax=Algivirga pacifica TaxID=1162670 RepID=A0ABP9D4Z7_9BACT